MQVIQLYKVHHTKIWISIIKFYIERGFEQGSLGQKINENQLYSVIHLMTTLLQDLDILPYIYSSIQGDGITDPKSVWS